MLNKIVLVLSSMLILFVPKNVSADNFTEALANVSNARFSYLSNVIIGKKNTTRLVVRGTVNLYPKDEICIGNIAQKCEDDKRYTVEKIIDPKSFTIKEALSKDLVKGTPILSLQKSEITLKATTILSIPINGRLDIKIPDIFDLNNMTTDDIAITGCQDQNWKISSIAHDDESKTNLIKIKRIVAACQANSNLAIKISPKNGVINPFRIDLKGPNVFNLGLKSFDGQNNLLDEIFVKIAQLEGVGVTATIGKPLFGQGILYGYTSPRALVRITGISFNRQGYSDNNGYFEFDNLYSTNRLKEICLSSIDQKRRGSIPVCISPPYISSESLAYGPVLLSPTVSLDKSNYFSGDDVILSGQTLPNTEVFMFFFTDDKIRSFSLIKQAQAATIPKIEATSNSKGEFSIRFPSAKSQSIRLFSQSKFDKETSPKSNTLYLEILPFWAKFAIYLLAFLFVVTLLSIIYLIQRLLKPYHVPKVRAIIIHDDYSIAIHENYPLMEID